jgi:hypothetical protein
MSQTPRSSVTFEVRGGQVLDRDASLRHVHHLLDDVRVGRGGDAARVQEDARVRGAPSARLHARHERGRRARHLDDGRVDVLGALERVEGPFAGLVADRDELDRVVHRHVHLHTHRDRARRALPLHGRDEVDSEPAPAAVQDSDALVERLAVRVEGERADLPLRGHRPDVEHEVERLRRRLREVAEEPFDGRDVRILHLGVQEDVAGHHPLGGDDLEARGLERDGARDHADEGKPNREHDPSHHLPPIRQCGASGSDPPPSIASEGRAL